MVIECSSCHARFKLADDKIKESGTKVRCTKCREVFTVFPESSPPVALPVAPPIMAVAPPPPVVTQQPETEEDSFFSEPAAPSFTDSPIGIAPEETFKTPDADDIQFSPGESDSDFEADFTSTPSLGIAASKDLNPFDTVTTDSEFTLSRGESLDDLSWDTPEPAPITTTLPKATVGAEMPTEDKSFDFNSFSFDEVEASGETEEKTSTEEVVVQSDATIELATGNDSSSVPIETLHSPEREEPLPPSLAGVRKESTPRVARPLRPRVRPKKKSFGRLIMKFIVVILLVLATTYGFMYRDQVEKTYSHLVNRFIEKKTRLDTSGTIGLNKLSGSYVLNRLEGELFVIHGEAVNDFKGLRSSVLVKGTIFADNGAVLQSQSAYCGNPLKESSLNSLSFKEIRDAMSNELGESLVNLNIPQGKSIPFTIVFDKPLKNIKEFSVEVLESKPGSN